MCTNEKKKIGAMEEITRSRGYTEQADGGPKVGKEESAKSSGAKLKARYLSPHEVERVALM